MLKILHTSDWHLGKKLYKKERHEEHTHFFDYLIRYLNEETVDVLTIAGDIFDSPTPPTKAISLFYQFLSRLETQVPSLKKVLAIGGNHDNGPLLEAPRPFLNEEFFKVIGTYEKPSLSDYREVIVADNSQEVLLAALPFFRPRELFALEIPDLPPFETLQDELLYRLKYWCDQLRGNETCPSFLIGHHLFGSYHLSGSELGVGLSGLDTLPLSLFSNWDNLILGHIHKPQVVKKSEPTAIYSGSPIPLRFSEENHKKMVLYKVEENKVDYTWVEIPVFRSLLRLQLKSEELEEVLSKNKILGTLPPYLELQLTDPKPLSNQAMDELRALTQSLGVELINLFTGTPSEVATQKEMPSIQELSVNELFQQYLKEYELEDEQRDRLTGAFLELQDIVENPHASS